MFKECLKYNIVPFIIEDNLKMFYYRGLKEWNNEKAYLTDTCLTARNKYKACLDYFRIPVLPSATFSQDSSTGQIRNTPRRCCSRFPSRSVPEPFHHKDIRRPPPIRRSGRRVCGGSIRVWCRRENFWNL